MRRAFALALVASACADDAKPPLPIFELQEHWVDKRQYPGLGEGRIIITNNYEDTVSIFDLATIDDPAQTELARVPVGFLPVELEGPHHAAMDPAGDYYYVGISNFVEMGGSGPHGAHGTGTADGYVLKYSSHDNSLVASARVDPSPGDVAISRDGKTIFVTHYDLLKIAQGMREMDPEKMNARLITIDAETMTVKQRIPLCPAPHGVLTSNDDRFAYASCYTDELAIVDLGAAEPAARRLKIAPDAGAGVSDTIYRPYAVAIHPTNDEVWVSGTERGRLLIYNPGADAMEDARAIDLDGQPIFGTFTADGSTFYVTYQNPNGVAIVDVATGAVVKNVRLPPTVCILPHEIVLAPGEQYALLACEGDHQLPDYTNGTFVVLQVAPGDLTYHHHVEVGLFPDYIGVLRKP